MAKAIRVNLAFSEGDAGFKACTGIGRYKAKRINDLLEKGLLLETLIAEGRVLNFVLGEQISVPALKGSMIEGAGVQQAFHESSRVLDVPQFKPMSFDDATH